MNLWVDDERPAPEGWEHVKTVGDALTTLIMFSVEHLSLDNDLGVNDPKQEGREIVFQLVRMQEEDGIAVWPTQTIRVHSANVAARAYMIGIVERYGPFRWDTLTGMFVRHP